MTKVLVGIPLFVAIGSIILNILFIIMFAWSYNALTHETIIAKVIFTKQDTTDNSYTATILDENDKKIGDYKIYGEQWRIDAKFMKMKYWANLLGLDSRYALERFEGRYTKVENQNSKQKLAHDLGEDTIIDMVSIFGWNPFIDAQYGSSTYQIINPEYFYTVYKTQTGVIVRQEKIEKENKQDGVLEFIKKINIF